jgi:hypothetical protein
MDDWIVCTALNITLMLATWFNGTMRGFTLASDAARSFSK